MERDSIFEGSVSFEFYFNSHAHVERDVFAMFIVSVLADFNSHAHVERDAVKFGIFRYVLISTHTLTWSVTVKKWSG